MSYFYLWTIGSMVHKSPLETSCYRLSWGKIARKRSHAFKKQEATPKEVKKPTPVKCNIKTDPKGTNTIILNSLHTIYSVRDKGQFFLTV